MSLGGEFLLCNDDLVAGRAVLAFGQTSLGAGCLNSRVNDFGMARRRDLFHTGYRSAADRALSSCLVTGFLAGSGLFRNFNRSMSSRVDCFGLGCIANCAGVGPDTGVLAGSGGGDLALIPAVALGGNLFLRFDNRSADGAADAIRQSRFGAGRRLAHNGLLGVAGRGNLSLCNENFVADGAMLTLGLAGLGAGRLDGRVSDLGMALGRDHFLFNDDRVADGAMLALGLAGFGAGRLNCRVDDLGVSLGGDHFLFNDDRVADGAVLAFGLAGFGAGSCNSFVDYFRMPLSRNLFLRYKHFIANRAMFAFGLAGCGAGSCNSFVDHLGMALGGDFFHTGENRLTNGALRTRLVAGLGAGGRLLRHVNDGVAGGSDCFGLGCIANCAGVGLDADVLTGRRGRDLALIPAVALGRNGFTLLLYFITNLAIGIASVAFLSAGRLTATTNLGQRVVILPAGFEGQIGEGEEHFIVPFLVMKLIRLESIVANSSGDEPTGEVIAFTGEGAFGKRVILAGRAVDDLYRIHRTDDAVGVKGDGQLLKFVEYCLEVNVLMRVEAPAVDPLRLIIGIPAARKDVGIVLILGSARGFVVQIIPSSRFLAGVVALLQDCVVPVQPADMVLVQRPLGVEGDIFVGGDVCLVGIGRAGAVLRRVPTGEIIVRAGEGVGGQGSRLIGLHGLRAHGSLAAVGVKGDDRVLGPLGIKGGILAEIHGRLVGIGRAGTVCLGIPAGEGVVLTGKGVGSQHVVNAGIDVHGLHAARAVVRIKGNGDFVALERPLAVGIHIGVAGLGTGSPCIGAVGVVQLGGGDGDLMCRHAGTALRVLIRLGLRAGCALLNVLAGAVAGADVRTAGGGVDAADGGQLTVDVHLYIRQRRTLTCPSGGIDHRDELRAITAAVAAPLIHVIDVDALAVGNHQLGTLSDAGLYAGQQRRRLVDSQLAAGGQIDGHVVGQRQNIAAGADAHACQLQVQAVDLRHTVDGIMDAIGGAVIRLGQTAGDDFEHTVVADKGNGGGVDLLHGVYRSIHLLAGAGMQGQGYLHILHGVLAKGEHLVAHVGSCGAAAEVQHLIPLVNRAAGLYRDGAAAGDKAPCVQVCAGLHGDGAAGLHFDVAIGPDHLARSTAAGRIILAADADGRPVCKGEGAARRHGQRPEYLGARLGGGGRRGTGIAGLGLVKGDQQGDSRRNGISTADGAISSQGNLRLAVCLRIGNRVVQVVKHLTAGFKERQLLADEPRRDGTVTVKVQGGLGIGADALSAGHIVPALEAIALRRGRRHLIGGHGALGVGVHLGDIPPVHGIGAVLGGLEGHGGAHGGHQLHVGHGDLGVGAGAAGSDLHLNGAAGCKLLAEAAGCGGRGVVHQNRTVAYHDGIVKGQRRLCGLPVGDGQRRTVICIAA